MMHCITLIAIVLHVHSNHTISLGP